MSLKNPTAGPDGMFRDDLPPTRGQLETIAHLAAQVLDFPLRSRADATVATVQLRKTITEQDPGHQRPHDF